MFQKYRKALTLFLLIVLGIITIVLLSVDSTKEFIGVVAGVVSALAFIMYVVDMFSAGVRPNRVSWFVWALIGGILYFSHQEAGGYSSSWVPLAQFALVLITFIFSLRWGEGGWKKLDLYCLFASIVAVILWQVLDATWIALMLVFADLAAAIPSFSKAWRDPASESKLAWALSTLANVINLFAITHWQSLEVIYPVYLFTLTGVMTVTLWYRNSTTNIPITTSIVS